MYEAVQEAPRRRVALKMIRPGLTTQALLSRFQFEAQTLANAYKAIDNNHEILTVLNKIDLPSSEPDRIKSQLKDILGIDAQDAALVSAKKGDGIKLKTGMIFTVEPMINEGVYNTKLLNDGWTAVTKYKSLSAQFEHTIGVTNAGFEIFTKSQKNYEQPPYLL